MARRRDLSDEDRAAYREAKRQDAEQRLDALLSQEGWASWLRLRRTLHSYSWTNQVLIATQALEQHAMAEQGHPDAPATPCSPTPTLVKSPTRWKRDGYHPAKGSRGLYVWTYMDRVRKKTGTWSCCGRQLVKNKVCETCGKSSHYFVLKPVFDASQVRSFETGQTPDLELPQGEPITGDEPGTTVLGPLAAWAVENIDGLADVQLDAAPHASMPDAGGWWDPRAATVTVVGRGSLNAQLRTLIHELAHASGISSNNPDVQLSYADAEVAVECVSYMVASTAGLDTSGESIPYMAGWGGEDARAKIRALAELIDRTAKQLEAPVLALLSPSENDMEELAA
ncbi:MAG: hypothetical protein QOK49_2600 [Baekduia sp.]|nr:hypothetical protein [Baekduia sp.]